VTGGEIGELVGQLGVIGLVLLELRELRRSIVGSIDGIREDMRAHVLGEPLPKKRATARVDRAGDRQRPGQRPPTASETDPARAA
jgi:hypothetical protein